jgi:hypothetical protein
LRSAVFSRGFSLVIEAGMSYIGSGVPQRSPSPAMNSCRLEWPQSKAAWIASCRSTSMIVSGTSTRRQTLG